MFRLMIKNVRKTKGLTQKQLSKKSKLSQSYISELETPQRVVSPTLETIIQIADALDCCPKSLLQCNCKYCKNKKIV